MADLTPHFECRSAEREVALRRATDEGLEHVEPRRIISAENLRERIGGVDE